MDSRISESENNWIEKSSLYSTKIRTFKLFKNVKVSRIYALIESRKIASALKG